uniref:Uncharacterized protein n=1 Tax=Anguilla anguilla TaxID=7936 RepID=A0A0E9XF62_ANGAN
MVGFCICFAVQPAMTSLGYGSDLISAAMHTSHKKSILMSCCHAP